MKYNGIQPESTTKTPLLSPVGSLFIFRHFNYELRSSEGRGEGGVGVVPTVDQFRESYCNIVL